MSNFCDPVDHSLLGFSVYGISRKEYWSRLPFPPSGDHPDPETEHMPLASPALAGGFFPTRHLGNLILLVVTYVLLLGLELLAQ